MTTKVEVSEAQLAEKSVLRNLMELYLHDFSEFQPRDLNADGLFGYRYLDHYWTEPDRRPYLIRADGKLAGFALVRTDGSRSSVAEFFVVRRYRRTGVGRAAIAALVEQWAGDWEVEVVAENTGGLAFWRSALNRWGPSFEPASEDGQHPHLFRFST